MNPRLARSCCFLKTVSYGLAAVLFSAGCGYTEPQPSAAAAPEVIINGQPVLPSASNSPAPLPAEAVAPAASPGKAPKHSYNSVKTSRQVVAMTFDDGPHPTLTPKLLDLLKEKNIRATFYVIGRNAAEYPEIMQRMIQEGHEVGNHTWTHPALTKCSSAKVTKELESTTDIIVETTGVKPATMRPPYGAINQGLRTRIHGEFDMHVIMWSVDPLDWRRPGSSVVARRIIQGAHPGAIILAHDIHPGTIEAMPEVFETLKEQGYEFVTVSEILAMDEPESTPAQVASSTTKAASTKPAPASSPAATASPAAQRSSSGSASL